MDTDGNGNLSLVRKIPFCGTMFFLSFFRCLREHKELNFLFLFYDVLPRDVIVSFSSFFSSPSRLDEAMQESYSLQRMF